jgi:hypothetical protein
MKKVVHAGMSGVHESSYARVQAIQTKPARDHRRIMTTTILTRTGQYVAEGALLAGIAFGATQFLFPSWSNVAGAKGSSRPSGSRVTTSSLTIDR